MSTTIGQFATPTTELEEIYPTFESWRERGQWLTHTTNLTQWEIADWLLAGEKLRGKKAYQEAAEITSYSRASLRNLCSVATKVSLRNDTLSFNHHVAVAKLPPEKQEEWLKIAARDGLSVRWLRRMIKANAPRPQSTVSDSAKALNLLAAARDITVIELKISIFAEYLARPEIKQELEKASATIDKRVWENRLKGQERWRQEIRRQIAAMLSYFEEQPESPSAAEFAEAWQAKYGTITRQAFVFAMKHTALSAHYAGQSSEDFDLPFDPPACKTVPPKTRRRYRVSRVPDWINKQHERDRAASSAGKIVELLSANPNISLRDLSKASGCRPWAIKELLGNKRA